MCGHLESLLRRLVALGSLTLTRDILYVVCSYYVHSFAHVVCRTLIIHTQSTPPAIKC